MKCPRNRVDEDAAVGVGGGVLRVDRLRSEMAHGLGLYQPGYTAAALCLSVLGPRVFPICNWVVRYSRYGVRDRHTPRDSSTRHTHTVACDSRSTSGRRARKRTRGRATGPTPTVPGPTSVAPVDGSTRHRGSAAQSPRDRSPTLARQRQRGNTRYAISRLGCNLGIEMQSRDGYGTRGTSTLTDHGESSPRGKGATRGATWSMDMRRGEHLHAGGAWP